MEALRDLADNFNARDPRKLYQLARQRDLDVTQAMAFEALKADVGRQVRTGGDGRLHPGGRRGTSAEQERRDGGPGHQARRAVTTDLGNEFATLDRELPEAARRTKRPEDRNAIAVVDRGTQTLKQDLATRVARKGGQWSDHFERAAGAYNVRPHETVHGAPEDVEKQPATEFRVLQDNADKFQHNKDLTDRRVKDGGGRDERGEELQPSVRRRAAAGGRGLPSEARRAGRPC